MDNSLAGRIKETVSMPQLLEHYGYPTNARGRIPCPLHDGKDNNFSYDEKYFKCFVCGKSGSVIDFVMELFHLSFTQAIIRIDNDLSLGFLNQSARDLRRGQREAAQRRAKAKREKEQAKRYLTNLAAFRRLVWEMYTQHKPSSPDEDPKPCFIYALQHLESLDALIAELSQKERR